MKSDPNGFNKARVFANLAIADIITAGKVSRQDHLHLTTVLLADQEMSDRDRLQINEILESVRMGKLELID